VSEKSDLSVIVLAAGEGTRMKSNTPKVLFPICGRLMIEYVLDAAISLVPEKIILVVGHKGGQVSRAVSEGWAKIYKPKVKFEFAWQREQRGTAHAVMCARDNLEGFDGDVLILYGDTPLITDKILKDFLKAHREKRSDLAVITTYPDDPDSYGRVIRDSHGHVKKITEARDLGPEQKDLPEINAGIYLVKARYLFDLLSKVKNNNAKGEFYLTDIVELAVNKNLRVAAFVSPHKEILQGVNDRHALSLAEIYMRRSILKKMALSGVTVRDPSTTYIDFGVAVGPNTVIEPFTVLRGRTRLGKDCVIGPGAEIIDSNIGDMSKVWFSVVEDSDIGSFVQVGPYSHIRPGSVIDSNVFIGNFAEVKNSKIGSGSKVHHHCYIGDSVIGQNVNIGAGTVTVNYDGIRKHQTIIEDGAFIGCNANLIAPVRISKNAYVAAGSTITCDVPEGALAIGREKQVNKEGWVFKRKQKSN